jgi:hypothetical protein
MTVKNKLLNYLCRGCKSKQNGYELHMGMDYNEQEPQVFYKHLNFVLFLWKSKLKINKNCFSVT